MTDRTAKTYHAQSVSHSLRAVPLAYSGMYFSTITSLPLDLFFFLGGYFLICHCSCCLAQRHLQNLRASRYSTCSLVIASNYIIVIFIAHIGLYKHIRRNYYNLAHHFRDLHSVFLVAYYSQ